KKIRVIRGGNRGGKTLAAAVEIARAVRGCDPFNKWPKGPLRIFCVGKDQKHLGQVMYWKLFRSQPFWVKRGKDGGWRARRPGEPKEECKPAPPLIPQHYIKSMAWENKKESVPSVFTFKNGTEMCFFSSNGKPPQGVDVDLVWFDEEIVDAEWLPEMKMR